MNKLELTLISGSSVEVALVDGTNLDIALPNLYELVFEMPPVGIAGKDGRDGIDGRDGVDGQDGESAYQIAVRNGFVGTELDWLNSLGQSGDGSGNGGGIGIGVGVQAFVYQQATPSDYWLIVHNTTYQPVVTVEDSSGRIVEGDVQYLSNTRIAITFAFPFSGKAYLR